MNYFTVSLRGFASGLKKANVGVGNVLEPCEGWGEKIKYWQKAEVIGMFSLAAAEIGMTLWGGADYIDAWKQNAADFTLPKKIILGASLAYLGYKGLSGLFRATRTYFHNRNFERLIHCAFKKPTP